MSGAHYRRAYDVVGCICGNSIRNVVPTPMSLSTQMCPSIFEITDMTLYNPSPVPFPGGFVV